MSGQNAFKLLISQPIELNAMDEEDLTINEALQTIYTYNKESSIYLKWNNYIIELNLAAQIADIYDDIIKMLELLINEKIREFDIYWGSSSFMAQWHINKNNNENINIEAHWTAVTGGKVTLKELNKVKNKIEINVNVFLREWLRLISLIKEDLIKAGYNSTILKDFNRTINEFIDNGNELTLESA